MKIKIHSVSLCNKLSPHSTSDCDVNLSNGRGKSQDRWWWLLEINFFPYRFLLSDTFSEWKLIIFFLTHVLIFELEVDDVVAGFLLENVEFLSCSFFWVSNSRWFMKLKDRNLIFKYSHRRNKEIIRKINFWFNLICFLFYIFFSSLPMIFIFFHWHLNRKKN